MDKQTFFSFKNFKTQTKSVSEILKFNFWPLVFFEIIYNFCGSILIYPTATFLLNRTLSASKLTFVSGSNFREIFTHPLALVIIFALILLLAFFVLLELTTLIILFNESRFKRKVHVVPLFVAGFKKSLSIIKPRNILLVFFVLFIIPFTNISFSSSFITNIKIPEFIMDFIYSSTPLNLAFTALTLFLSILVIHWMFCLNSFTLENKHFITSIRESCILIKKRFLKTILTLGLWNLLLFTFFASLFVLFFLLIAILATICILAFSALQQGLLIFSILLGIMAVISTTLLSFISLIGTSLNIALISTLYYDYSEKSNILRDSSPMVVQRNKKPYPKKTVIILSSILFVAMISFETFAIFENLKPDNIAETLGIPQVTAHRGSSRTAPENTIAALEGAIASGADYAEIDVAQTRDGVIVVSHDNNLKRISGQNINIWESDYNDIKDLDIGSWFDPAFSDQRLPTLEEAIDTCKDKIKLNIELKPTGHEESLVESTIAIVNKKDFQNDCLLASLDYKTIQEVMALEPKQRVVYITAIAFGHIETLPVDVFSIEASFVTPELVSAIHRNGKQIHVWTVDHEDMIESMINLDVDNLITDDAPLSKEIIKTTTSPKDIFDKTFQIIFNL